MAACLHPSTDVLKEPSPTYNHTRRIVTWNLLTKGGLTCYVCGVDIHTLEGLTKVLQASISPVALVSGVGLLILSQTNRFSRVTDRLREKASHRRSLAAPDARVDKEIAILHRRARLLKGSITAAVASVLLASVLVLFLFGMAVLDWHIAGLGLVFFALSLVSLIVSLGLFIVDMQLSLKAIEEELRQ